MLDRITKQAEDLRRELEAKPRAGQALIAKARARSSRSARRRAGLADPGGGLAVMAAGRIIARASMPRSIAS